MLLSGVLCGVFLCIATNFQQFGINLYPKEAAASGRSGFITALYVVLVPVFGIFMKKKVNPMIGAAGISAFPMSGRIVHKMALKEDPQNFLLMHSIGVNASGQIASVIAGGIILNIAAKLMGG